nr:reverse transcriptase domain-containing protein [Tanacetum cinerariifolium]
MEIVIPKVGGIDDDILLTIKDNILRENLLNVNHLFAKIEASNDNPIPFYDPIISGTPPNLTPFGESDFFLEVNAFLAIEDEPTSSQFPQSYLDPEGDILLLEAFLNDDYSSDFKTNDDQSCSDEDVLEKIVSKPLFEEEIIPMKIDQHPDNAESDLMESLRTHYSSLLILWDVSVKYEHVVMNMTYLLPPAATVRIACRSRVDPTLLNDFEMATDENGDPPVLDLRTMEELCQPTLNGRVNEVIDDALRLYLFPHSLTHHATAWFDRLPRNSINTFEQMAKMFLRKYFPPSIVTKLRNEFTDFRQRPDESLFKVWNLYEKAFGERYDLIKNMTAHHNDWDTFVQQTTVGQTQNVYAAGAYQGGASHGQNPPPPYQALAYQVPGYQALTNMNLLTNSNLELKNMFGQFMNMNTASSSGSRTLPSNTITNLKEDLKGITTRSVNAYKGPTIPTTSCPPKVVERETEPVVAPVAEPVVAPVSALKPNQKSSIPYLSRLHDQKLCNKAIDQKEKFFQIFKDLDFNISFTDALILMPKFGLTIKSLLTNKEKLHELARTLLNEHCSAVLLKKLPEKLGYPGKFLIPFNRIDLIDVACEEYSQEVLGFFVSGNPTPSTKPIVSNSSPTLTPFGDSDFLLEETDAFLAIDDEPISSKINGSYYDSEGDILLLE